ncbi:uncharacterized protein K460DRAFT_50835 [Cucurbitaria berberidis CBS 394.84]|uniref:Uncharacterized protein n=1 Tax=Cucurbitaria berberidis CBS 394.84 TaxID=1168544 RepID=A0A9P4GKX7_9PLEO|nr:uncharacterized protein K460DRAFT_50835 [Cucurbitaria berberidis CBS 394.84]KAF1846955.1 hypothetical protein K460DRAFT_50835 [Cucurbitaria berberidis CBS 394.84]
MATFEEGLVLGPLSLDSPTLSEQDKVCQYLWDWPDCTSCRKAGHCPISACPWSRKAGVQQYLQFYKDVACGSRPADTFEVRQALRDHNELLTIIRLIKSRPSSARRTLMQEHFAAYDERPSLAEQNRAFDVAIRLLTMVECSTGGHQRLDISPLSPSIVWKGDDSAIGFAESAVRLGAPLTYDEIVVLLPDLTAQNLESHGMVLVQTNNIREHLLYNPRARIVHVYHYAGFLKECLWPKQHENPVDAAIFPRQLAFETLYSLQSVLFPWHDQLSRAIVEREGFDRTCLEVDNVHYSVQFEHWGARMRVLARVLETGRPTNALWAWLKRRSRMKLVMLLIAAFAAIVTVATFILEAWKRREKEA